LKNMPPVKAAAIAPSRSSALYGPLLESPNRRRTTNSVKPEKAIT
jgi:hypothetical protein